MLNKFDFFENYNKNLLKNYLIYFNQNKKRKLFIKKNQIFYVYVYICINSYITNFNLSFNDFIADYKIIKFNIKNNQLFASLLKDTKLFKSFSTGYILNYLELFKKSLKKQTSSYIMLMKILLKIIEKFFLNDILLLNIVGTKKNFFKWLNFLKLKSNHLKILIYIYSPSIFNSPIKIKKIKSIKKRMKKKYLYNENMI